MNRRTFLSTSPAFFAALALSAKHALPVGFPTGYRYTKIGGHWYQQRLDSSFLKDYWVRVS